MANPDDTSKPRRSRRDPTDALSERADSAATAASYLPPERLERPQTLEQKIEYVRALLMQIRATLHCLSGVLLYAEDDDAVMYAEVAKALEAWVNEAAVELDLVKLRPLIRAIQQSGGSEPGPEEPDLANRGPYQVREPTPVYMA